MADPLVSVVTPSFNQAEFIEETILSVRNQDYRPIEHIVVDGGSTDGTVDVLRRYEDEYPLTWLSEPDEGQSHAINKGFDLAEGDLVGWLNSDDVYFDTGVLSRVVGYFGELDADVIYGDVCFIDRNSTVTGVSARPPFDPDQLRYRNLVFQPAAFFRGAVVGEHRLDVELKYSMDYEFWLRLARKHTFQHVPDVLAGFRMHGSQKTEDVTEMDEEAAAVSGRYETESTSDVSLVADIVPTEVRRILSGVVWTVRLRRHPPTLAFPGDFASTARMMANVLPRTTDVTNAFRRTRER